MRSLLLLLFVAFTSLNVQADGIEFFQGDWKDALRMARQQDKPIFVDAYAKWCGPCKRMAKTVFKDSKVGDFYNQNFISMKIDMETGPGQEFMRQYPVSAFPTLYYINGNGKVIINTKGARNVQQFIDLGKQALSKNDNSADYAKSYEEGDRDPKLIYNYVKALNKANKPSLKIANEYLNSQDDLTTDFNLKFILEATHVADSRIFDMLVKHKSKIVAATSEKTVKEQIVKACQRTMEKSIEFESEELLNEAKDKMKQHAPDMAGSFAMESDLLFYKSTGNSKAYLKAAQTYVKKEVKNDASRLNDLARNMEKQFSENPKAMAYAEKLAKKAVQNGGLASYYKTYAMVLYRNGKKSDALKAANRALKMAKEKHVITTDIEKLIYKIENS